MSNSRILLVFSEPSDADTLVCDLLDALTHAGRPYALRFALPYRMQRAVEQALAVLPREALRPDDLCYYEGRQGLSGVSALLRQETHFLALKGSHGFSDRWDRVLLRRYAMIEAKQPLLTAWIEGEYPQAFLPAFAPDFEDGGVRLQAGLPLVHSARPIPTLAITPAFLFGPVSFLKEAETAWSTLSIAAHIAGYPVYALDRPALWPLTNPRERRLRAPAAEELPHANLNRFERLAGLSFDQRAVSVRATLGLFSTMDGYAQALPPALRFELWLHTLRSRRKAVPLCVSAFRDLPEALKPPIHYVIRFSYLSAIAALPLLLYTGGGQERLLRTRFPNTLAYPDNGVLPRSAIYQAGMTETQHFRRSKWLLMLRALRNEPARTHVAWVDADVLPHPLWPKAAPDFSALMDDRVHIGWVNGAPDLSFIVVPRKRLSFLAKESMDATRLDVQNKRSLSERALVRRWLKQYPDLFTLHPLPQRELLFLTGFDPRLLSARLRLLVSQLPPAFPAEALTNCKKEANS